MTYNLLKKKQGIISGVFDEMSIAWHVAEQCYNEGAKILLTNKSTSIKNGSINVLAHRIKSKVLVANLTSSKDINNLLRFSYRYFNNKKIDFLLHSIAMSYNIIKDIRYYNLNYKMLLKSFEISALSLHKLLQEAWKLNILNKYASIVVLSYIGANRVVPLYNEMGDFKSYLESIVRNFGYYLGRRSKIRINIVSQSPILSNSTKCIKNFQNLYFYSNDKSPLGNATREDCAKYIISLFSDLTRKVTMQTLYHDGGYSAMGI